MDTKKQPAVFPRDSKRYQMLVEVAEAIYLAPKEEREKVKAEVFATIEAIVAEFTDVIDSVLEMPPERTLETMDPWEYDSEYGDAD